MFYARNFKTPTLVIHGEQDYRVPYGNGLELYAALQAQGVPSRLVIFPDENHWVLKPQNAIYWHWEMQSWLARFIGGKPTLEKPRFEDKKDETEDKKEGAAKPAEAGADRSARLIGCDRFAPVKGAVISTRPMEASAPGRTSGTSGYDSGNSSRL